MTKDAYSYRSFHADQGGSDLEAIRAQIVKQEVTRIIRKKERERIAAILEEQEAKPRKSEPLDITGPAFVLAFKVLFVIGLLMIAYVMARGAWHLITGMANLLL